MALEQTMNRTINEYGLLKEGESVLVALSGGADSVALLLALSHLKDQLQIKKIYAAHLNHCLRDTADRDEAFSRNLCNKLGIEFYCEKTEILNLKATLKLSEEEAGRFARYDFLIKLKKNLHIDKIATAHHKDDQLETFFMRILRGASLDGLLCIKPHREDAIIRPLIFVSKDEIYDYLKTKKQDFVTDETNFSDYYLRNDIRLHLLPYLKEQFNPSLCDVISNTIKSFTYDSEYINQQVDGIYKEIVRQEDEITINLSQLNALPKALLSRILIQCVKNATGQSLHFEQVSSLMELIKKGETGKSISIDKDTFACIVYDKFFIKKKEFSKEYCYKLNLGVNYINEIDTSFIVSHEILNDKNTIHVPNLENLKVRTRKNGDRIYLKKLNGHKKIKDIFIDKKIPRSERDNWPILTYQEEIIWIVDLYQNEPENNEYTIRTKRGNEHAEK